MLKIGINGFGRIGRCVARVLAENIVSGVELVAFNGRGDLKTHYHLLKYDSIHGRFPGKVEMGDGCLIINGKQVKYFTQSDPSDISWGSVGVDVVFECTGVFKDREGASKHFKGGAKKVLISAPAKGDDIKTIVYGVNEEVITDSDDILSVGSCTTNCLAPVAKVLNDALGIEKGFVTTIHAFTNDQNTADARHSDLRRARAASLSMIPSSTGAAKAIGKVLPELAGKLDGVAIRVPTPNVSLVDFCFLSKKPATIEEVNKLIKEASNGKMKRVLGYDEEPCVSIDYNHTTQSSIFDSTGTRVLENDFIRVASWYDNEWAFSIRMLDVAKLLK
jgi:glyceraldehyde 3-phosphate dehydrogenase